MPSRQKLNKKTVELHDKNKSNEPKRHVQNTTAKS